jgi:hypothetical protein
MALILASTVGAPGHPRWFSKPAVVVAGANSVSVTTGSGDNRETQAVTTSQQRAVPAALPGRLAGLGAAMVVDYAGYAAADGVPGSTVHPWPAAALHAYTWVFGGPPHGAGQIVLTSPVRLRSGGKIIVQTAAGPRPFTVSGVIRTHAPAAMYATGAVAARLAGGRIDAIALTGRPGEPPGTLAAQVRAAVRGQGVRVLTGGQRRAAEPNPDADLLAMLAPVLIPPLAWLLSAPLAASAAATGMLARRSAMTAVRRTAATAAPVLVTAGIAGSLLAGLGTMTATQQDAARSRLSAPFMITPAPGAAGLAESTVAAVRAVPGVAAAVPVTDTTVYVPSGGEPNDWTGQYVSGPGLAGVTRLPVVAGSRAGLTGTGTVAVPAGSWRLGQTATLWLGDSTPVRLRVVAVLASQIDLEQTVLLPSELRDPHTSAPLASAIYLRLAPGARLAAVRAAAATGGGTLRRTAAFLSAGDAQANRTNRLALIAILGLALLYTGIAIANTLVMATGSRKAELATLRLSGATPSQVLRVIGVEAFLVSGIGILFAAAVTTITLAGLRRGLSAVAPAVRLDIPWQPITAIALACLLTALLASLIPAAIALRRPPLELAGAQE